MFQLRLLLTLFRHSFSLSKDNLRYISWKRILLVVLVFPSFTLHLLFNRLLLALDQLFFPAFRKVDVEASVFIVGVPRSATTFLYHKLMEDEEHFHAMKLWEMVFAPSIIQKYFYIAWHNFFKRLGFPIRSAYRWIDRKLFAGNKMRNIHKTGFFEYEEDEMIFLWNLSSTFLYFFFPMTKELEKLIYHDRDLPEKVKRANFKYYKNCIKRHKYVYDRKNQRRYVSKNPTFTSKLNSLYQAFPNASYISTIRTPLETIPSTISLMAANYEKFCHMPEPYPMQEETRDMLIDWYIYTHQFMKEKARENGKTILYSDVRENLHQVLQDIYSFLALGQYEIKEEENAARTSEENQKKKDRTSKKSQHHYDPSLGIDLPLLRKKLGPILPKSIQL
jgi:hypothetical protein